MKFQTDEIPAAEAGKARNKTVVKVPYGEDEEEFRREIMPKVSTKKNKSIYQLIREEKGLSREKASELLEWIAPERLERIENDKFDARPDEIMTMAEKYGRPDLCNYYCTHECAIGKEYVPEVKMKELTGIVMEMLASFNTLQKNKERLIEITSDGEIDVEELGDFIAIEEELEKLSLSVETLKFWVEKRLSSGEIDKEEYEAAKSCEK